jgi:signal transduction histidine kinase
MNNRTRGGVFKLLETTKGRRGFDTALPTATALVKKHDGRIEVESEPGKGSTFTTLIPDSKGHL